MVLPAASIIGWSALNLKRSFQPSNILTKSLLHTEITTGKSDRWSKGGTKIWKKISVHPGYHALMNQCLFGSTSSFPGWIFCPRKPHPFGNKYHSICCGLSGIMYAVELREGKDAPAQRQVDPKEKKIGKTGCLLLRLTKALLPLARLLSLTVVFCSTGHHCVTREGSILWNIDI